MTSTECYVSDILKCMYLLKIINTHIDVCIASMQNTYRIYFQGRKLKATQITQQTHHSRQERAEEKKVDKDQKKRF